MKSIYYKLTCVFACLTIVFFSSCKKDNEEKSNFLVPTLSTGQVYDIMMSSASSGGIIKNNGGDTISSFGVCWSLDSVPTMNDEKTEQTSSYVLGFSSSLAGLSPNTTYYVRAYAINSAGTGYGDILKFKTLPESGIVITDIDGNIYHSVTIGTQVWMAENLRVGHYRNGSSIPNVIDKSQWDMLTTGAYCYYENSYANGTIYGKLYNFYSVADSNGLCPSGWHVPTKDEWLTLINFLGGEVAGNLLKETGTDHWESPNEGANNQSGFTALPGGIRANGGQYYGLHTAGYWWTSSEFNNIYAYYFRSAVNTSIVETLFFKSNQGMTVRCIRD